MSDCRYCLGLGATPYGLGATEQDVQRVRAGLPPLDEDGEPSPLHECRDCRGWGTVDEDCDPRNYEPEMFDEYRFTPER